MMPTRAEFKEALAELQDLARRYHGYMEDPQAFLDYVTKLDERELREYLDRTEPMVTKVVDGIEQISPVNFLRRVIATKILSGERPTLEGIEEIQKRIEAQDIDYFKDFPRYLEPITAQKERARSAFANWNPFRVLFYMDYHRRNTRVQDLLRTVALFLREELKLNDCDSYLGRFSYNQNFGTDHCWVALFPERLGDHKEAVQIFLGAQPNGFEYGLVPGSKLPDQKRRTVVVAPDQLDIDQLLSRLSERLPEFVERNGRLPERPPSGAEPKHVKQLSEPMRLNVILHGPPGTGKTYTVQRRAVEIVDGGVPEGNGVTTRFRQLVRERRVEFLTFHPSYSYEEFVEGFRYDPDERIPVLKDGVFKELVARAVNPHQRSEVREGAQIWKVSLGGAGEEHLFQRCLEKNEIAISFSVEVDLAGMTDEDIRGVFESQDRQDELNNIRTMTYFVNELKDGDYVLVLKDQRTIRAIGTVEGEYKFRGDYNSHWHTRPVRWLDKRDHDIFELNGGRYIGMPTLYKLNRIPLQDLVRLLPGRADDRPHVLIIDEINRGNLSRIFGELITLLEPDKRQGGANELTVRLPYSQQPFTVPANIHVLGTMNTADRSIALMDVALRRRFSFEELMPDVEVIRKSLTAALDSTPEEFELTADQIELVCRVFEMLNRRITVLLDRDHQIGHSYFLQLQKVSDLHRVMYQNVFPLVQEYFYNNRETLTQLLGRYDPNARSGFIRTLDDVYGSAFDGSNLATDQTPWEIHRYKIGELEEALSNTFSRT